MKTNRHFLLLVFFFLMGTQLFAQDKNACANDFQATGIPFVPQITDQPMAIMGFWYPAYTYPTLPVITYFQEAVWLGDTLYLHAPSSAGAATTEIYKYKLNGTWTTGTPLPTAVVGGAMVKCGSKLYYLGGGTIINTTTPYNTVYEYTPSTGTWVSKATMPLALSGHSAVAWGDSVIFVIGGPYTGSGTNLNVYYYNVNTNTWGTITNSLPTGQGRRTFALGIAGGNKIVMAGGYNTAFLKSTYVGTIGANASQITWTAAPDVPTVWTGLSRPGGAYYGSYFFIICGEKGGPGGYYDTTHIFNTATNTWIGEINNIPFKRSNIFNGCSARLVNDTVKIFVPGGYGSVDGTTTGAAGTDRFDVAAFGVVIPVELTSFSYNLNGNNVVLTWSTATETNNKGFEVQKSLDGKNFSTINFVGGNGTTTNISNYTYIDKNVSGIVYYRLKQIDFDGTSKISNIVEVNTQTVVSYILKQNYPNPFNPSTTISYQIPEKNFVSIKVIDVLGNEVATVINSEQDAGLHNVTFNASNLASGIYLYQLKVGNYVQTKRMMLMK